ncbi:unnamed protein product [Moneuplotes crassus]|uniref:Uncharacterized protein n=1 Tax=Euplotes crassus TaxID=5936 RepID=A0AAD2D9V1_EUPCR|nr:unnamed protein product [Moneuplotes crassus]
MTTLPYTGSNTELYRMINGQRDLTQKQKLRRMENSSKNSYVKSPSKHAKNTPSGLSKNLADSGKMKKRKRRTSKENVDNNAYMKRSAKAKQPRRLSLEDRHHHFPSSIKELESDYSQKKISRKSPNRLKKEILDNIYEGGKSYKHQFSNTKIKNEKSRDSSRNILYGSGSPLLSGSASQLGKVWKLKKNKSPFSSIPTSQFSMYPTSASINNNTQLLKTSSMMTQFKDMSKKVSKQLGRTAQNLKKAGTYSQKDLSVKKSKLFTKKPQMSKHSGWGYQCPKKDRSINKSKSKLSTRRKGKNKSHHTTSKRQSDLGHSESIKNNHILRKYLERVSDHNGSQDNGGYRTIDPHYTLATQIHNTTSPSYWLDEEEEQRIREEHMNKQELKEIEDKLERDHNNYLQRKQTNSEDHDPEEQIRNAAETALKNLSESQTMFAPVLDLISKCYDSYIMNIEEKHEALSKVLKDKDKQIMDFKEQLSKFQVELATRDDQVASLQETIKSKINEIEKIKKEKLEVERPSNLIENYDEKKIYKEIKELLSENEDLKTYATQMKADMVSELEYSRQRENKLMYFLFLLQQKDYPVFDVFEKYISGLETNRFSTELDEDYKNIYIEQMRKLKDLGLLEREPHKSFCLPKDWKFE